MSFSAFHRTPIFRGSLGVDCTNHRTVKSQPKNKCTFRSEPAPPVATSITQISSALPVPVPPLTDPVLIVAWVFFFAMAEQAFFRQIGEVIEIAAGLNVVFELCKAALEINAPVYGVWVAVARLGNAVLLIPPSRVQLFRRHIL